MAKQEKLTRRQQAILEVLKNRASGAERVRLTQRPLAEEVGCCVNTLRKELKNLVQAGWLDVQTYPRRGTLCILKDPHDEALKNDLKSIKAKTKNAAFTGEGVLHAILDLIVDETHYQQQAKPSFLRRPTTAQLLEYDRYYEEHRVAIEFNGPQHETDPEQVERDLIKLALGWHQRVRLITFTAEELQVATVYEKLKGRLPLRDLAPDDPRVQLLDEACERYRRAARQKAWQARGNPTKNAQSN